MLFNQGIELGNAGLYSGSQQTELFNAQMKKMLRPSCGLASNEKGLELILSIADENHGKETFDKEIRSRAHFVGDQRLDGVKRLSDYCYYLVGAETNNVSMSANAYLNQNLIAQLGAPIASVSSFAESEYDPAMFADVLVSSGAIESPIDFAYLTVSDIRAIEHCSGYDRFVDAYLRLHRDTFRIEKALAEIKKEKRNSRAFSSSVGSLIVGAITVNGLPTLLGLLGVGDHWLEMLISGAAISVTEPKAIDQAFKFDSRLHYGEPKGIAESIVEKVESRIAPMLQVADLIASLIKAHGMSG